MQPLRAFSRYWLLLITFWGSISGLLAQTTTWTGGAGTTWNNPGNWSAGVPTIALDAVIPSAPTNQPVLSTTALANSVEVQSGASLSITAAGSLTINGAKRVNGSLESVFYNAGTVSNSGKLFISDTESAGYIGLWNRASFINNTGGSITIDQVKSYGLYNEVGNFTNRAQINLGASVSVGAYGLWNKATFTNSTGGSISVGESLTHGILNQSGSFTNSAQITIGATVQPASTGLMNQATFTNNAGGIISINRGATAGLFNNAGTFTNAVQIIIGANAAIGDYGLQNQATFLNTTGGSIAIDRSSLYGLYNESGSFTNAAQIRIGATAAVGYYGLLNQTTFNNQPAATLTIDRASTIGLMNFTNGSFINAATLTIGATASVGQLGIYNQALFNNTGCEALLTVAADAQILDGTGGTLTNSGTLIENYSGASNIAINSGLVRNLNGGSFTIATNTGLLTTASSGIPIAASISASPSLTVAQGQSTTLTASGALAYRWSTGETSSVISASVAGTYSVTGTLGNCFADPTTSVTSVSLTVRPNVLFIAGFGASPNPVVEGQPVSFTATLGNLSTSYSYTLSNGSSTTTGSGSGSGFSQGLIATPAGPQTYTLTVGGNTNQVAVATTRVLVSSAGEFVWTGNSSTDWNTATNWSSGKVPRSTDDVVIPAAPTNQPVVSTTGVANSVEVQSGASLSITAGGSLTVVGSKTVNSLLTGFYNDGTVSNAGRVLISNSSSVSTYNIYNRGSFTNTGQIVVAPTPSAGGFYGVYNVAIFNNTGCEAVIDVMANAQIWDGPGGTLINSGTLIEHGSTQSRIASNSGLVRNLNGGSFTITNNTGVLTMAEGKIWTGCTNNVWTTATNWSGSAVPTATDDVVIPTGVTNQPLIGSGILAVARSVEVQSGTSLSITAGGRLTINGSKGINSSTAAFYNGGTVGNSGQLFIGNTATTGDKGFWNHGTFTNNTGATLTIDRSTTYGLYNESGTFTNAARITIGANASAGYYGLYNKASFSNNSNGIISIDQSTTYGLYNDSGTFTNIAQLNIGATASVGSYGLRNQATFNNNAGATLTMDRSTIGGLINFTNSSFTNLATITIGATASVGQQGLYNLATFNNTGCEALLTVASNSYIEDSGTLTNSGTLVDNYSGASNIAINSGLVRNLAGGSFTIANNTGVLTTASSGITIASSILASPSLTIVQGQSTTLTASGALAYRWSTGETSSVISASVAGTYSVTGTLGNCFADPTTSVTSVSLTVRPNVLFIAGFGASPNPVVEGQPVSFTATLGNLSTSYSYTLSNGSSTTTGSGSGSGFSQGLIATPAGPQTYTLTVGGNTNQVAVATTSVLVSSAGEFVWTGNSSTDWNTAGNWSSGKVPRSTDDVVIPAAAANQPVVSTTGVANSVEVQSGASLSITAGGSLTVTGSKSLTALSISIGFYNGGTVSNRGQLLISNSSSVSTYNIYNQGNLTNLSQIIVAVTPSAVGFYGVFNMGTFNNTGCDALINVMANALINDGTGGTLTNSGAIIENSSGISKITNNSGVVRNLNGGTFTITNNTGAITTSTLGVSLWRGSSSTNWNSASNWCPERVPTAADNVVIPATPANQPVVSTTAIANSVEVQRGASLSITATGSLSINGSTSISGLTTDFYNGGTVSNSGQLLISNTASSGNYSIRNLGTFTNTTGADITINRASVYAIYNESGQFTNLSRITIGASPSSGFYAVFTAATFNNTGCEALINVVGRGLIDEILSGTLTSSGTIIYTYSGGSKITNNSGLVRNLGGGGFTITNNTGVLTTAPGGVGISLSASPSLTIAQGQTTTLTASGALAYRWSTGETSSSISVSVIGPYSVTGTLGNCTSVTSTVVSGDGVPDIVGFTATSATVCMGSPATFTAIVSDVTGNYTYTLTNGNSTTIGTSGSSTFSQSLVMVGSGSQSFTLTISSNGKSTIVTTSLFVNTLPTATITPNSATLTCASPSVSLTASGGNTYRWENNFTNAIRTVSNTGTYSVTVTSANGCMAIASRTITSNMSLTATAGASSTTALVGNVVSLSASGGTTYQWLSPTGASLSSPATTSLVSATLTTSGPKTFSVTVSQGSCSQTLTVGVTSIGVPDLVPILYATPSLLYGNSACSLVVDVMEVKGTATNGLIQLYITKDPLLSLSLNGTATLVGGRVVQNSVWSLDAVSNNSFYIVTTSQSIEAMGILSVGLSGQLSPGNTKGNLGVSGLVVGSGAGELNTLNNSGAVKIDYFNK